MTWKLDVLAMQTTVACFVSKNSPLSNHQCIKTDSSTVPQLCFMHRRLGEVVWILIGTKALPKAWGSQSRVKCQEIVRKWHFPCRQTGSGRMYSMDHCAICSVSSHMRRLFRNSSNQERLLHISTFEVDLQNQANFRGDSYLYTSPSPRPCASRKSEIFSMSIESILL